jgi:hypothetical protein
MWFGLWLFPGQRQTADKVVAGMPKVIQPIVEALSFVNAQKGSIKKSLRRPSASSF